jgi:dihydroflavonol-4-reductase
MDKQNILVTGISGFIAKHCAIELIKHGYAVRGTVRSLNKVDEVRATLEKHGDVGALSFVESDLNSDAGWEEAAKSVYGVLHVASPFVLDQPKNPEDLIRPAVDGTLRVLRAAEKAGVKRFVQTSSSIAITAGHPKDRTTAINEDDWTVLDGRGVNAYAKSKTLAERAARDFIATSKSNMHYCSVNPGFVLGPMLDRDIGASAEVIQMFLRGKYPGVPKLAFPVVDVRDIALMHRLALETKEPSGGRYFGFSELAWFMDMMRPIKAELGAAARKVPSFELPNAVMRVVALFDAAARGVVDQLGYAPKLDNNRTRNALGITFRPVTESAPAMARSLIEAGLV